MGGGRLQVVERHLKHWLNLSASPNAVDLRAVALKAERVVAL